MDNHALTAVGTLYDGTRKRLSGEGPKSFNHALDKKLCIKVMLHFRKKETKSERNLVVEDRLWALPDTIDLTQEKVTALLLDLSSRIRAGNKVGLAGQKEEVVMAVRGALMLLLQKDAGYA